MKKSDILGMGFRNLLRRKTRTFLTVIGVVVGAVAIVIMLSLGIGMNENLNRSIERMGDLTIIDVPEWPWRPPSDDNEFVQGQNILTDELLEKIRSWDGVVAATPFMSDIWGLLGASPTLHAGRYQMDNVWNLVGIDSSFLPYLNISELEAGVMPQPGDEGWVLLGSRVARQFYDSRRPPTRQRDFDAIWNPDMTQPPRFNIIKERMHLRNSSHGAWYQDPSTGEWKQRQLRGRLRNHELAIAGIISYNPVDQGWGWEWDEFEHVLYIDYRVLIEMVREMETATRVRPRDSKLGVYSHLRIKVRDIRASERVQGFLAEEGIVLNWGLTDMRDEMQQNQAMMQMILGGIGAMSLLVAAIGIANTMFMSIYERTKEIGVMKVLGCPLSGIKSMFLFEASIIGFFGGLIGTGISLIGSHIMNTYEPLKNALGNMSGGNTGWWGDSPEIEAISIIPLWLVILAVVFATVIGLVSGYMPARRATKISALEAIRSE
jgi:ABC-type lipoprotein release transport system permease subunit